LGKIEDARDILRALGLPPAQCNEISAITLLALSNISEQDSWEEAARPSLRIHDILIYSRDIYGREYAENTRETVRRQVIHQFEQARVVDKNPDDPSLPTNSPRTHYALTDAALRAISDYETSRWNASVKDFVGSRRTLLEIYQKKRRAQMIPVTLPSGKEVVLSPGVHNQLQAAVVEEFAPRFAPGSVLAYMGDTARKTLHLEEALFERLSIPVTQHDKLPDVVLYDEARNWLFLVEAVTSHGPVSPKRHYELEQMLQDCTAQPIYVSAFPDFSEFKKHLDQIAWETEVWLSEIPDHLIHYNGDKFLGPYE